MSERYAKTMRAELNMQQLPVHEAVWIEAAIEAPDGSIHTLEGAIPEARAEAARESGDPISFLLRPSPYAAGLPANALWRLLPREVLELPLDEIHELWLREPADWPPVSERMDSDAWMPVFVSLADNTVWDIRGRQLNVIVRVEMWGSLIDLHAAGEHLAQDERVLDFQIIANPIGLNEGISGRELGVLTLRLTGADLQRVHEVAGRPPSPELIEGLVANLHHGGAADVLGLAPYRRDLARS
jgi:hypothetical protein